jgi:hypothetical protein
MKQTKLVLIKLFGKQSAAHVLFFLLSGVTEIVMVLSGIPVTEYFHDVYLLMV